MKQISTIPLLAILTKYAAKHAVAFSGAESNAIVEAMYEYASEQTEKYKELIEAQEKYIKKADSVMGNWECSHAELTNLRFIIGRLKTELGL